MKMPAEQPDPNEKDESVDLSVDPSVTGSAGRWTEEEHAQFLAGMEVHGNNWIKVSSEFVPSRTPVQIRSHAQKHFSRMAKAKKLAASQRSHAKSRAAAKLLKLQGEADKRSVNFDNGPSDSVVSGRTARSINTDDGSTSVRSGTRLRTSKEFSHATDRETNADPSVSSGTSTANPGRKTSSESSRLRSEKKVENGLRNSLKSDRRKSVPDSQQNDPFPMVNPYEHYNVNLNGFPFSPINHGKGGMLNSGFPSSGIPIALIPHPNIPRSRNGEQIFLMTQLAPSTFRGYNDPDVPFMSNGFHSGEQVDDPRYGGIFKGYPQLEMNEDPYFGNRPRPRDQVKVPSDSSPFLPSKRVSHPSRPMNAFGPEFAFGDSYDQPPVDDFELEDSVPSSRKRKTINAKSTSLASNPDTLSQSNLGTNTNSSLKSPTTSSSNSYSSNDNDPVKSSHTKGSRSVNDMGRAAKKHKGSDTSSEDLTSSSNNSGPNPNGFSDFNNLNQNNSFLNHSGVPYNQRSYFHPPSGYMHQSPGHYPSEEYARRDHFLNGRVFPLHHPFNHGMPPNYYDNRGFSGPTQNEHSVFGDSLHLGSGFPSGFSHPNGFSGYYGSGHGRGIGHYFHNSGSHVNPSNHSSSNVMNSSSSDKSESIAIGRSSVSNNGSGRYHHSSSAGHDPALSANAVVDPFSGREVGDFGPVSSNNAEGLESHSRLNHSHHHSFNANRRHSTSSHGHGYSNSGDGGNGGGVTTLRTKSIYDAQLPITLLEPHLRRSSTLDGVPGTSSTGPNNKISPNSRSSSSSSGSRLGSSRVPPLVGPLPQRDHLVAGPSPHSLSSRLADLPLGLREAFPVSGTSNLITQSGEMAAEHNWTRRRTSPISSPTDGLSANSTPYYSSVSVHEKITFDEGSSPNVQLIQLQLHQNEQMAVMKQELDSLREQLRQQSLLLSSPLQSVDNMSVISNSSRHSSLLPQADQVRHHPLLHQQQQLQQQELMQLRSSPASVGKSSLRFSNNGSLNPFDDHGHTHGPSHESALGLLSMGIKDDHPDGVSASNTGDNISTISDDHNSAISLVSRSLSVLGSIHDRQRAPAIDLASGSRGTTSVHLGGEGPEGSPFRRPVRSRFAPAVSSPSHLSDDRNSGGNDPSSESSRNKDSPN